MQHTIDQIVELGREHRTAIREQTTLSNMLKARVREYVGFDALRADNGEKLDFRKAGAAYKRLITEKQDPLFLNRVRRIMVPCEEAKIEQGILAKRMGYYLIGGKHKMKVNDVMVETDYGPGLPIWAWGKNQRGCGAPMLAKIIAEAGRDLSDYETPAKLWKRFGEHVVNGQAPRARRGEKLGFSPYRRSVSFQLGDSMIKAGGTMEKGNLSPWKAVYEHRKRYEVTRAEANGLTVVPTAKITKKNASQHMSEGHVHNRAMRYMRKKFLEALWQEWTGNHRDMELPDFIKDPKKGE